jgi:TP901 family phage tail tape measure protein
MASPELKVRVGLKLDQFKQGIKQVNGSLQRLAPKMKQVGQSMTRNVSVPIGLAGVAMLKTAGDFEQGMNKVQALTQASEEDFISLENQAKQLGKTTKFSAREASEGMSFLAMAGFETNEIMSAMPNVLQLAASANLDLGSSADIVSNVMQGFGQDAEDLNDSVDVLTKAFVSSNTDLSQLGQAMKFVAPVAKSMGVSFEETTAAVGFLSDAGVQAGMAGRGLRSLLIELTEKSDELGISVKDSSGNMLPMADILEQLEEKGFRGSDAIETFTRQAGPVLSNLLARGSDELRSFTSDLEDSGGIAGRIADQQMEGLNGALTELRSALEGLFIAFADSGLLESFTELVDGLTEKVRGLSEMSDTSKKSLILLGTALALSGPLMTGLGTMITVVKSLNTALATLATRAKTSKKALAGAGGLATLAAAIGVGAISKTLNQGKELKDLKKQIDDTLSEPIENQSLETINRLLAEQAKHIQESKNQFTGRTEAAVKAQREQIAKEEELLNVLVERRDELAKLNLQKQTAEEESNTSDIAGNTANIADNTAQTAQNLKDAASSYEKLKPTVPILEPEDPEEATTGFGVNIDTTIPPPSDEEQERFMQMEERMNRLAAITGIARQAFTQLGQAIATSLTQAIMQGKRFGEVLKNLLMQLASQALQKFLTIALTGGAGGFLGGIGGGIFGKGGGLFGKIGGALFGGAKMATGGIVPAGFPNDTYPALLTSGEMVVPKPHPLPNVTGGAVEVFGEFRVRGSDLVTAISNTNNRTLR